MRTVPGPTDKVVVVGAGLAGLSAALRLCGAGREVTVLERAAVPGGRAGRVVLDGHHFDTGPTVLTMPDLIADALDCVGESLTDRVDLRPVDPAYRGFFPAGVGAGQASTVDVHADPEQMAAAVQELAGAEEADGYRRFVAFVGELYRLEIRRFIDRNLDSPASLERTALARIVALGGLRRLAPVVARYLKDERLQRMYSFQAMYAGLAPHRALALYAVIAYMDSVAGVYAPVGGMHAVPRALADAAAAHGVRFHYDTEVTGLERAGSRVSAVTTADGRRFAADAVVVTTDLPVAYAELFGRPVRRPLRYSPSCVLVQVGHTTAYPQLAHHSILFGTAWRQTFDELFGGRLMSDPSLLVTDHTYGDPALAPPGRHTYTVLAPAPHTGHPIDWAAVGPRYRDELVATVQARGLAGFADGIEVERVVTPADWEEQGLAAGAPFSLAHTFAQTGPFRPGNLVRGLDNVVLAGSGTQPGVGVPMVLISGRLAAERITGPDPTYRSRAWREPGVLSR